MVNFSKFDVTLLLVMSLAVIGMSFTFPALGLVDASTSASDIPSFNLNADRFNAAGTFPEQPGTPSSGTLELDAANPSFSENEVWLDGGTSGGTQVTLLPATSSTDDPEILVSSWNSGNVDGQDRYPITQDARHLHSNLSYEIAFEVTEFDESNGYENGTYTVSYEVRDQKSGIGWLDRIPVVGGLVSGASQTAAFLGWIGSIFWWFLIAIGDVILNGLNLIFSLMAFLFDLIGWLGSTYTSILGASGAGWVRVFLALPGIIISLILVKAAIVGVSLLPTT